LAFEEFAAEGLVEAGPVAVAADVFLQNLGDAVELGVEVVEEMEGDGLKGHGEFGAAEFILAVMADDEVLEPQQQFRREFFLGESFGLGDFVFDGADDHDDVADELAFVAVAEFAVVSELIDFAGVVQEGAEEEQIAVELGIERSDDAADFHQTDDVGQEAAAVGVVVFDSGGGGGELAHEVLVGQEALGQIPQMHVANAAKQFGKALAQPVHLFGADDDEILLVDLPRIGGLDPRDDHLELAVVDLRGPGDAEIVARFDRVEHAVAGVPEHTGEGAGFVGEAKLEVEIAVAVGAELLIGDEKHLVDVFAFAELVDVTAEGRHAEGFRFRVVQCVGLCVVT
jgi:hypothetical protein